MWAIAGACFGVECRSWEFADRAVRAHTFAGFRVEYQRCATVLGAHRFTAACVFIERLMGRAV